MKCIGKNKDFTTVELSTADLEIINNALNEICNGVEIPAFQTRIGYDLEVVEKLLADVGSVYRIKSD